MTKYPGTGRSVALWKVLAAAGAISLTAAGPLTPLGGSLYEATQLTGDTYVLKPPIRIYACESWRRNCFVHESGSFTIDNSGKEVGTSLTIIHLAFEDGALGWMAYNDFLAQKVGTPAATRRVVRLGMAATEIRAEWGAPDEVEPTSVSGIALEKWTYSKFGRLYFEKGKVSEIALIRSLPVQ